MKMIEKRLVTLSVTILCLVFICGAMLPLSLADATDTTPPVTVANVAGTMGTNGWYVSNVTVHLSATDSGTGVNRTVYSLDNAAYTNFVSDLTLSDGNHTILFRSYDNAGNSEGIKALNVGVDTIAPVAKAVITGSNSSISGWYNRSVTVNLTATDSGSKLRYINYSLDSGPWTLYTGNLTVGDGQHTLAYSATDGAGNVDIHDGSNQLTFDVSNITVTGYKSGTNIANEWYSTDVVISLVATGSGDGGLNHIEYTFDNKTWTTGDTLTVTTEGWRWLYYRAVDNAGIIGNVTVDKLGIDKTAPTIGISIDGSHDKQKGWWNGDITIHLNANDASGFTWTQYSWDNKSWNTYSSPFKLSRGGSRTIYFRTGDVAGRTANGSYWIYFAPGSYDQGGMSNQVYINGGATPAPTTGPGTATAVPIPSTVPIPTPTQIPLPTPTPVPADAGNTQASGSGAPLAIAVLVGVLVLLGIIAAAAYLFVFKPK